MEPRSLKYVAESCGGILYGGSPGTAVTRVCTDSREVERGDLFFALKGDRFDGEDYVPDVIARGAAAAIVQKSESIQPGGGYIKVDDTRAALGKLALRYRSEFELDVIVVAGSNGKTTTKELIASVLRQAKKVLSSLASFNNDIGVPLTLLNLKASHQAAVLEAGTNHPGELAPLVRMARPRFGVITNVGREHLEFFRDLEGVAEEEGWLAELLPENGKLFLGGDGPGMESISRRCRAPVVRISSDGEKAWKWRNPVVDRTGTRFWLEAPEKEFAGEYRMQLLGSQQVANAVLAIRVGKELGLDRAQVARGLAECRPAKMRMELKQLKDILILNDAYNANPDSMAAGLRTLADFPCAGRRVAVLGDMAELGEGTAAAHAEIGRLTAALRLDLLVAVGSRCAVLAEAARSAGIKAVNVFAGTEEAVSQVPEMIRAGDVVLVKASRSARLERLAAAIEGHWT